MEVAWEEEDVGGMGLDGNFLEQKRRERDKMERSKRCQETKSNPQESINMRQNTKLTNGTSVAITAKRSLDHDEPAETSKPQARARTKNDGSETTGR